MTQWANLNLDGHIWICIFSQNTNNGLKKQDLVLCMLMQDVFVKHQASSAIILGHRVKVNDDAIWKC